MNECKINEVLNNIIEEYINAEAGEYKVYYHQNKINNKIYVGVTRKKNINDRWKKGNGYKHNYDFFNDIALFGWDGFVHVVLLSGVSQSVAYEIEERLISELCLTNREFGYNISIGGENGPTYKNGHTHDAKVKMSDSQKKRFENKSNHPWLGRHHTIESRNKMMEHNHTNIMVKCVETDVMYRSIHDATRKMGLKSKNSIKCALDNPERTSCGYHWITINDRDEKLYERPA